MMNDQAHYVPATWRRLLARWLDQLFIWMVIGPLLLRLPQTEDGWIQLSIPWAIGIFLWPDIHKHR